MSVIDYAVAKSILRAAEKRLNEPYTAFDSWSGQFAPVTWMTPGGGGGATSTTPSSSPLSLLKGTDPSPISTGTATIISIIMAVTAAYLQWTCDYTSGGHMPLKILQTIIAGLYGSVYIVFFLIFLYVPCSGIKL